MEAQASRLRESSTLLNMKGPLSAWTGVSPQGAVATAP